MNENVVYRADYPPQELLDLGLSPKFVEFVFLDPKPDGFRYRCESRSSGWACFVPKDVSGVYPLWTSNADVTALWLRCGRLEFVQLYHDDPEWCFVARTEQGLLLQLFLALYEYEDWTAPQKPVRRLQEMAEVAGFGYLAQLMDWHEQNGGASDFSARWDCFVESIDQRQLGPAAVTSSGAE